MTTPFYDNVLSEITAPTVRAVFVAIKNHIGKGDRITKRSISMLVFARYTSTTDRTIRECVEILHSVYGVPICTTSGLAGYYMPANREELAEWIAEHRSRAYKELDAVRKVEDNCNVWFGLHEIPDVVFAKREHVDAPAEQMELI